MRYFSISANIRLANENQGFASTQFESEKFPSYNEIVAKFEEITEKSVSVVIIAIFEFKDLEDYNSFLGKNDEAEKTYEKWLDGLYNYMNDKMFIGQDAFNKIINGKENTLIKLFESKIDYNKVVAENLL